MKAVMQRDTTDRVVTFALELGRDDRSFDLVDQNATWRSQPRPFAPDSVRMMFRDGQFHSIAISGPTVLKSGRSGTRRETMIWHPKAGLMRAPLEKAPRWVQRLAWSVIDGLPIDQEFTSPGDDTSSSSL